MKKTYIVLLSLSSIVIFLFIMKFFGWTIVVNRTSIDKWLLLIAVFSFPSSIYIIGFTHYCGESKQGYFRVKRKTSRKKLQGSV